MVVNAQSKVKYIFAISAEAKLNIPVMESTTEIIQIMYMEISPVWWKE